MKIKDWTDAANGAWMDPTRNRSGSDLTEVKNVFWPSQNNVHNGGR